MGDDVEDELGLSGILTTYLATCHTTAREALKLALVALFDTLTGPRSAILELFTL
jgi:hypothetical protein